MICHGAEQPQRVGELSGRLAGVAGDHEHLLQTHGGYPGQDLRQVSLVPY